MVACVAFAMSILHDAGNPDTLDVSWPTLFGMMVVNLCRLAGFAALLWNIVRKITRLINQSLSTTKNDQVRSFSRPALLHSEVYHLRSLVRLSTAREAARDFGSLRSNLATRMLMILGLKIRFVCGKSNLGFFG